MNFELNKNIPLIIAIYGLIFLSLVALILYREPHIEYNLSPTPIINIGKVANLEKNIKKESSFYEKYRLATFLRLQHGNRFYYNDKVVISGEMIISGKDTGIIYQKKYNENLTKKNFKKHIYNIPTKHIKKNNGILDFNFKNLKIKCINCNSDEVEELENVKIYIFFKRLSEMSLI